jgi:hypothetical protein
LTSSADESRYAECLERLRAQCAPWPGVVETFSWGNPTFKANRKSFAVLDCYEGEHCLWVRCAGERRQALLGQPGYFEAPYDRRQTALCRRLDGLDWATFDDLLRRSYESVMPG